MQKKEQRVRFGIINDVERMNPADRQFAYDSKLKYLQEL